MVLGAVVDAGVDPEELTTELSKLNLDGEFHLSFEKSTKHDITGTKALVETYEDTHRDDHNHHHKHTHGPSRLLSDIFSIIDASQLQSNLCDKVKQIFDRLAEAEAKVHNKEKSKVHLHEVSGIDSIVDIVGSVIGLDLLGIEKVYASPISLGRGFVRCAHGMMPVPVPGTMELLQGIPIRQTDIRKELVTPTGAAIITTVAGDFGVMPNMTMETIGYGAGTRDLESQPNLLRICIGKRNPSSNSSNNNGTIADNSESHSPDNDKVNLSFNDNIEVIETNVDDMTPEIYGYVMDKLFEKGALDVFFTPILMKKGRPAIQISVLSPSNVRDMLIRVLLTETTTFGVRIYNADRIILDRDYIEVNTEWGPVRAKRGYLNGMLIKTVPEYEDCKTIAEENAVPLQSVYQAAHRKI
jgi:uncharacterized protein (TIGR00299 family) protein